MKAVILAAGRGVRLESSGWSDPKCLLPVRGTTVLDNMLDALLAHGVREFVVVVGYRQELVRAHFAKRGLAATWVENPDFASTNTINSLWRCAEHLDDDFLYFNADVLFHPDIVGRLLAGTGNRLAIDGKACGEEEVKVVVDEAGRVRRIGKALDPADCRGEFIGVGRFDRATNPAFVEALRRHNEELGNVNLFFEAAIDDILDEVEMVDVDVSDLPCIEIDFPEDYDEAKRDVSSFLDDDASSAEGAAGEAGS